MEAFTVSSSLKHWDEIKKTIMLLYLSHEHLGYQYPGAKAGSIEGSILKGENFLLEF